VGGILTLQPMLERTAVALIIQTEDDAANREALTERQRHLIHLERTSGE
jgi:hypothetical protein